MKTIYPDTPFITRCVRFVISCFIAFYTGPHNSGGVPVSILRKSISGRHRPVRVADGPMTARCRFT